jgi:hypothetical protein
MLPEWAKFRPTGALRPDPTIRSFADEGRTRRAFIVLPAAAEALSGHQRVMLVDVSRMGAQLKGDGLPTVGKCIILRCGSIDTFGTIVWSESDRRGMQFDEEISSGELSALRALSEAENESELTADERQAASDWLTGLAR